MLTVERQMCEVPLLRLDVVGGRPHPHDDLNYTFLLATSLSTEIALPYAPRDTAHKSAKDYCNVILMVFVRLTLPAASVA